MFEKCQLTLLGMLLIFSTLCFANQETVRSEATEKLYLTQILNQLNTMQSLILAAEKMQIPNTRMQFHYIHYKDSKGQWHNGLLEDVQAIKAGIVEKLNDTAIEPRVFAPVRGDYRASVK